ncbi:MAG: helix-turn-helix transcriptional regulator [Bacillota bacterium]|nr:helix-turn-helix transcriptional regulator [Bacillota bacterium]
MLRLRRIRDARGLSLAGLCQLTGISEATLSRIEREHIFVYPGWRRRISEALSVTEEELFQSEVTDDEAKSCS